MRHLTPWWFMELFDRTLRPLLCNAQSLVAPHVRPGPRVADIGCGAGYFSVVLSRLVGPRGEVVLVDVQPEMLERAQARCARDPRARARLTPVLAEAGSYVPAGHLDFALLAWMLHEVPDPAGLWRGLAGALAPGGRALVIEPHWHVSRAQFEAELAPATALGLTRIDLPGRCFSRIALLQAPRNPEAGNPSP